MADQSIWNPRCYQHLRCLYFVLLHCGTKLKPIMCVFYATPVLPYISHFVLLHFRNNLNLFDAFQMYLISQMRVYFNFKCILQVRCVFAIQSLPMFCVKAYLWSYNLLTPSVDMKTPIRMQEQSSVKKYKTNSKKLQSWKVATQD